MKLMITDGTGKHGTNKWKINMAWRGDTVSPRQSVRGDTGVRGGVTGVSPEPSFNRQLNTLSIDAVLDLWKELFPKKRQPKRDNSTESFTILKRNFKERSKDGEFLDVWKAAMLRASKSKTLKAERWFSIDYFLGKKKGKRANYLDCYDGWMDWKDEQLEKNRVPTLEEQGYTRFTSND
jgi:hypothetical protein